MSDAWAVVFGVFLASVAALISSYVVPVLLDKRQKQLRERDLKPRKELLIRLLEDNGYKSRKFETLRTVSGMKDDECRDLLIKLGVRGVLTVKGNEAWALISKMPFKEADKVQDSQ
jgi:hypothetical protein